MIVNIDGSFIDPAVACLPLDDGAVLFGDSLFETLKAKGGRIRFLEEHLDRIELAARLLAFPFERSAARKALTETAQRLASPVARLRLTLTRGAFTGLHLPPATQGRLFILARPHAEPTESDRTTGVVCVIAPNRRVNPLSHLPQMKRGNYADCLYAADFARRRGAREALFVNAEGRVLEGATSNLFALQGDTLVTPPAGELVLAGIMRRQVLRVAAGLGLQVKESDLPLDELYAADEVFLSNSLIDLLPVSQIEGRPLHRGVLAERLRTAIDGLTGEREKARPEPV
jgi:branched-subunit amino acid aminotransferase/4-amino-4-deoxychorismate lyase